MFVFQVFFSGVPTVMFQRCAFQLSTRRLESPSFSMLHQKNSCQAAAFSMAPGFRSNRIMIQEVMHRGKRHKNRYFSSSSLTARSIFFKVYGFLVYFTTPSQAGNSSILRTSNAMKKLKSSERIYIHSPFGRLVQLNNFSLTDKDMLMIFHKST